MGEHADEDGFWHVIVNKLLFMGKYMSIMYVYSVVMSLCAQLSLACMGLQRLREGPASSATPSRCDRPPRCTLARCSAS